MWGCTSISIRKMDYITISLLQQIYPSFHLESKKNIILKLFVSLKIFNLFEHKIFGIKYR